MGRPLSPTRDLAPGRLGLRDWSVQDQVSGAAHLVKRRAPLAGAARPEGRASRVPDTSNFGKRSGRG